MAQTELQARVAEKLAAGKEAEAQEAERIAAIKARAEHRLQDIENLKREAEAQAAAEERAWLNQMQAQAEARLRAKYRARWPGRMQGWAGLAGHPGAAYRRRTRHARDAVVTGWRKSGAVSGRGLALQSADGAGAHVMARHGVSHGVLPIDAHQGDSTHL